MINALNKSDEYIDHIFMMGGCYQFYLFLKAMYPSAIPYINYDEDHIVTKIGNNLYDIRGLQNATELFVPLPPSFVRYVKVWSFSRNRLLQLDECEVCGEPIVF